MSKVSISISLAMARELRDWAEEEAWRWPSDTQFQRDLVNLKEHLDDAMSPGAQRMERK